MPKSKIGDVIEIPTSIGLAYAHYTHYKSKFGAVIRIFEKLYKKRPESFDQVVLDDVRFTALFPLDAALKQNIFSVAGNARVREELQDFPVFRNGMPDPKTKKVRDWWLWDGEREYRVGDLTEEQFTYPELAVLNDTMVIKQIESDWRPEIDYRD